VESGANEQLIRESPRLQRYRQTRKPAFGERLGKLVQLRLHGRQIQAGPRVASNQERPQEEVELVIRLRGVGAKIHSVEYSAAGSRGMLDCPSPFPMSTASPNGRAEQGAGP